MCQVYTCEIMIMGAAAKGISPASPRVSAGVGAPLNSFRSCITVRALVEDWHNVLVLNSSTLLVRTGDFDGRDVLDAGVSRKAIILVDKAITGTQTYRSYSIDDKINDKTSTYCIFSTITW